jgi:putative ABC transport system permease protein
MNNVMQDIRYAVRLLRQRPVHAAIIIGTLALGIGLNTAVFSVINSMLLKPLPFPGHHQLVALWLTNPELKKMGLDRMPLNYPTFADWQNHMVSYQSLGGFQDGQMNFKAGGDPERVRSCSLTSGFFETLGVRPFLGRHFLPEEYHPGKTQAVILSHAL